MLSRIPLFLVAMLLACIVSPLDAALAAAAIAAPVEDDDCVESTKIASAPERLRQQTSRSVQRPCARPVTFRSSVSCRRNGAVRSASTAFLSVARPRLVC